MPDRMSGSGSGKNRVAAESTTVNVLRVPEEEEESMLATAGGSPARCELAWRSTEKTKRRSSGINKLAHLGDGGCGRWLTATWGGGNELRSGEKKSEGVERWREGKLRVARVSPRGLQGALIQSSRMRWAQCGTVEKARQAMTNGQCTV